MSETVKGLTTPQPSSPAATSTGRLGRAELTDRITALFSSQAEVRQSVQAEIDATLERVPREVAEAALRDWYGDLMGHSPDVDPETDVTTDLATRVDRQRRD